MNIAWWHRFSVRTGWTGASQDIDDLAELRDGAGVERSRLLQLAGYLPEPFHWRDEDAEQQLGEYVLACARE